MTNAKGSRFSNGRSGTCPTQQQSRNQTVSYVGWSRTEWGQSHAVKVWGSLGGQKVQSPFLGASVGMKSSQLATGELA